MDKKWKIKNVWLPENIFRLFHFLGCIRLVIEIPLIMFKLADKACRGKLHPVLWENLQLITMVELWGRFL